MPGVPDSRLLVSARDNRPNKYLAYKIKSMPVVQGPEQEAQSTFIASISVLVYWRIPFSLTVNLTLAF
jgi:hypothetical protein